MALDKAKLDPTGSGSKGAGQIAIYETTDAKATVVADGYFDAAYNELAGVHLMAIKASDATLFVKVTRSGTTDIALAEFNTII